jgi:FkbM family methyltransferase
MDVTDIPPSREAVEAGSTGTLPDTAAPFISYAQNYEDVMLWRALRNVRRGRYLDVGAGEPEADSVTRAFYDRGWCGVNIDPLPGPFARLREARPRDTNLNLAVGAASGEAVLHVVGDETGLSTLDPSLAEQHREAGWKTRETRVRVATLAEICATHVEGELHFLKIDAEGAELDVLRGADFRRWRPWIVLLEAVDPVGFVPQHEPWEAEVLGPNGYHFVWFDGLNRFYLAAEREAELAGAFRTPPNLFDGFVRAAEVKLQQRLDAVLADAEAAGARVHAAQERADESQARVAAAEARADEGQARAQAAQERADHSQARVAAAEAHADMAQARAAELQNRAAELQNRVAEGEVRLAAAQAHRAEADAARDQAAGRAAELELRLAAVNERLARAAMERDEWAQELFESNRYAADLTRVRQDLLDENARLRQELQDEKSSSLEEQAHRVQELEDERTRLIEELDGAREEAADKERWLKAMRASSSWRLTGPVRALGHLFGRGSER